MDAHPIPQDVTSFQFKLIGDMTLKQFTYLAAGLGSAYIIYVFLSTKLPLVAWPLIAIFSLAGISFAFLPISDRPLDHWLKAFLKASFAPTQRTWQKKGVLTTDPYFKNRLDAYVLKNYHTNNFNPRLASSPTRRSGPASFTQPKTAPFAPAESDLAPTMPQTNQPQVIIAQPQTNQPQEVEPNLKNLVETAKRAQIIQTQILQAEHQLGNIKSQTNSSLVDKETLAKQFQQVLGSLQSLTKQAKDIQAQLEGVTHPVIPAVNTPKPKPVTIVPATPIRLAEVALTSTPNIINGVVTDSQTNYLEGVIVVTHDKEGLPVRALRTNKLGQFIAATPLPNGTYTISLEKDDLSFDNLKIELNGALLPAIKVSAKPAVKVATNG